MGLLSSGQGQIAACLLALAWQLPASEKIAALARTQAECLAQPPLMSEAEAPGQRLWCLEQRYRYSRDRAWLLATWPRIALDAESLARRVPDGRRPVWAVSWAVAGLRAAAHLARENGRAQDAARYRTQAEELHTTLLDYAGSYLG
ncbi:MAG: hypothetical protein HY822_08280, partial [Acidobacteria bacterium]|nr:hypothetical protein [Acidobacteriota bacterium]